MKFFLGSIYTSYFGLYDNSMGIIFLFVIHFYSVFILNIYIFCRFNLSIFYWTIFNILIVCKAEQIDGFIILAYCKPLFMLGDTASYSPPSFTNVFKYAIQSYNCMLRFLWELIGWDTIWMLTRFIVSNPNFSLAYLHLLS